MEIQKAIFAWSKIPSLGIKLVHTKAKEFSVLALFRKDIFRNPFTRLTLVIFLKKKFLLQNVLSRVIIISSALRSITELIKSIIFQD